ncbi:hypothetical protein [uncultured Prevotella sp.]|jgi:hypothetical protein|uniref:hypothetical protein n=1 Tax=uncultured Prevotella sp. TaxID=159272 RepID=UPI0027E3A28A|nr:hypothetical protein [uncultured Prevotella sp.]
MNETIENIAELCGWKVFIDNTTFEFEQMIGTHDFVFAIQCEEKSLQSFVIQLENYLKNFDVDYETSIWIGKDGHGTNGAPYHIKDILDQMYLAKEQMAALLYEIKRKL